MKLPRLRFTVRRMMALVAVAAVCLLLFLELKDGFPPRFLIRSIPSRFAKLKPGMSRAEVNGILRLNVPWWRGGIGAGDGIFSGNGHYTAENYVIGQPREVTTTAIVDGVVESTRFIKQRASIHLRFGRAPHDTNWESDDMILNHASFFGDGMKAEMPGSR